MDVTERVSAALACVAFDPHLSGVLLLDLDPVLLFPLAVWLAELIGGPVRDSQPPVLPVVGRHTDEALWGRAAPTGDDDEPVRWVAGVLDGHARRPGIVVVPDLARLSLPAARAAVTLTGADVAHLERPWMSATWRPRDRWLATLWRQDVGTVSPHLLDRFSVRIDTTGLTDLLRSQETLDPPGPQWRQAVRTARTGRLPRFSDRAADRVAELLPAGTPGLRRDLALARVARALAGLAGEPEAQAGHVDRAAALIGISPAAGGAPAGGWSVPSAAWSGPGGDPGGHFGAGPGLGSGAGAGAPPGAPEPPGIPQASAPHEPGTWPRHPARPDLPDNRDGQMAVRTGGEPQPLPATPASGTPGAAGPGHGREASAAPYPEDEAMSRRVADPLRYGWQRGRSGASRGYPIGIERARDLNDIAVVPTLLEALAHQARRCATHREGGHPLHVRVEDLRGYRRVPWTGHLLVLLLDHTCRAADWDWLTPLSPFLSWAYVNRAQVGVVEVGATGDSDPAAELRASEFRVRSLLDPRVEAALEARPGRATPLAHGLMLAAAVLRHDTQQGAAPVTDARLVVVTDGRANVPLSDSQLGAPPANVGRRAVHDAESAARAIRGLHRVQSMVIAPESSAAGYLATRLAESLAAPIRHAGPAGADDSGAVV